MRLLWSVRGPRLLNTILCRWHHRSSYRYWCLWLLWRGNHLSSWLYSHHVDCRRSVFALAAANIISKIAIHLVLIGDLTSLRNRVLFSFIPALPFLINAWVSGDVTQSFLGPLGTGEAVDGQTFPGWQWACFLYFRRYQFAYLMSIGYRKLGNHLLRLLHSSLLGALLRQPEGKENGCSLEPPNAFAANGLPKASHRSILAAGHHWHYPARGRLFSYLGPVHNQWIRR